LSTPPAFLERYELALQAGARARDPAQEQVAQRLHTLESCLRAQTVPSGLRTWLASLRPRRRYDASCRGIYLWGTVGRGKTWLMDLLHAGLPPQQCQRRHFQHFMRDIHARLAKLRRQQRPLDRVAAQLARQAQVWCLDEFMVQDISDAMILHGVLDGLLQRGVVLVMTSNTPPQRLYEGGLQRERFLPAIALLTRQLDVLEMAAGIDYRLRELQNAQTWLPALRAESTARMRELFQRLAGNAAIDTSGTLLVEDRPVATMCHADGLAWFTFAALCDGPRSAQDYIAIARNTHTVFLSDVPVFDNLNDDAARRFIALIDELYDQNVKLVVSAAAEPAALYRGERLAGQFERTASRLIEMRSSQYLAQARQ
jgi:cell division protein ZapE